MHQRILQKRRYEIDRQRSEIHEKLLGEIKVESAEVVLLLKSQSIPGIFETQKGLAGEGKGFKDLQLAHHTQNKSLKKSYTRKAASRKQTDLIFHLRPPWWSAFGSRCLDLYVKRSLFGSSIGYRAYRVVAQNAPIMVYAYKGNITGIQQMFSDGTASPYDRDVAGLTVLGVRLCIYFHL
jgi:hypothetical protein